MKKPACRRLGSIVGNNITMGDCCLVPALWGTQRVDDEIDKMSTVKAVFDRL